MPEQTAGLIEIIARLEQVERENRRLKRIVAIVLLGVSAFVLMGQAQKTRTVEAEQFIVRDQNGKMRAKLSVTNYSGHLNTGESALEFYNETGKELVGYGDHSLAFESKESLWTIISPGEFQILTPDGRFDVHGPHLTLADGGKFGSGSVSLGIVPAYLGQEKNAAAPGLILSGNYGKGFVSLNTGTDGPRLHMEAGPNLLQPSHVTDIAADSFTVSDKEGFAATIGHSQLEGKHTGKRLNTSAASLVLTGKDGVLWSAP
jgi:hypothetical protein